MSVQPEQQSRPAWPGEFITVDGREAYVRHTPPASADAEPALYVHGLGGSSTNWTDLAALLADRLDGVAVDLPGFGRSEPSAGDGYTPRQLAGYLTQVIEQVHGGPVHLLGNSLGGTVALELAARRPDLVRTLTLVSPAMPDLRPRVGPDMVLPLLLVPGVGRVAERRMAAMTPEERAQGTIDVCFADPSRVPPDRLAEAIEEVRRRNELPYAMEAFLHTLRGLVTAYLAPPSTSLWARAALVKVPSLVVWGREDKLVNVRLAQRTAHALTDSRLLVLDGIGHTAQLEAPAETAEAIRGLLDDARR